MADAIRDLLVVVEHEDELLAERFQVALEQPGRPYRQHPRAAHAAHSTAAAPHSGTACRIA